MSIPLDESMWVKKKHYFRVDGKTSASQRKLHFTNFNISKEAYLCLLTTRAASLGCSLIAANRMVIVDHTFNPSFNIQATCRIYRLNQKRDVFIYRLVVPYTSEHTTYKGQITKESQSMRVIYKKDIEPQFCQQELIHVHGYELKEIPTEFAIDKLDILKDSIIKEIMEKNVATLLDIENHGENFSDEKICIKLILPGNGNEHQILMLNANLPIKVLVAYCEELGFCSNKYKLLNSDVPKQNITSSLDISKSFRNLQWPPREVIIIAEKK